MYALIFFTVDRTSRVIKRDALPEDAITDEEVNITIRRRQHNVRILEFHDDQKYLESLEVSKDGIVQAPKEKRQYTKKNMTEKAITKANKEAEKRAVEEELLKSSKKYTKTKNLSKDTSDNVTESEGSPVRDSANSPVPPNTSDPSKTADFSPTFNDFAPQSPLNAENVENLGKSSRAGTPNIPPSSRFDRDKVFDASQRVGRNRSDESPHPLNSEPSLNGDSSKTNFTLEKLTPMLEGIMQLLKQQQQAGNNINPNSAASSREFGMSGLSSVAKRRRKPASRAAEPGQNPNKMAKVQVEIQPGSGVFVNSVDLSLIKRWTRHPPEMVRRLMLYLIGAEELKEMSARGRSGNGIPTDILDAVKYYVDEKGLYVLSDADYTRVINNQIGTLRNPKGGNPRSGDSQEKKEDSESE